MRFLLLILAGFGLWWYFKRQTVEGAVSSESLGVIQPVVIPATHGTSPAVLTNPATGHAVQPVTDVYPFWKGVPIPIRQRILA